MPTKWKLTTDDGATALVEPQRSDPEGAIQWWHVQVRYRDGSTPRHSTTHAESRLGAMAKARNLLTQCCADGMSSTGQWKEEP